MFVYRRESKRDDLTLQPTRFTPQRATTANGPIRRGDFPELQTDGELELPICGGYQAFDLYWLWKLTAEETDAYGLEGRYHE